MQAKEDVNLVKRVLAKERAAFDEFFSTYFSRLSRFCRTRVHDEQAVEDIVQETMIKAVRNLESYRGEALLFTWLCGICRNEISNWFAKHGKHAVSDLSIEDDAHILAALESFGVQLQDSMADQIALSDLVTLTLDYLPDKYGKALEMKYLEGLSVREIGTKLGMGRLATQSLLSRARVAFRGGFSELVKEANQH
ncbi:MAG: sigma-70 family RNA polymerase sigma factor [Pseudomonadales bacterium]|nr:sigma-70 family RNA polymerase sigma factor [Pseudomonadales bacterium]